MNLFQIILVVMVGFIVAIWIGSLIGEIEKLKKEKKQTLESMQKRRDIFQELNEDSKDKIYITFNDFINNQKLPSKLELVWEILANNNVSVKYIIQKIEDGSPYPPDTKVHWEFSTLKVTPKQIKMIEATRPDDGNMILLDNNYPLYIKLDGLNIFGNILHVVFQAGYRYDDNNHTRRDGGPSRPTKH